MHNSLLAARSLLIALAVLVVSVAPALALDPQVALRARATAASAGGTHALASKTLSGLILRHRQIRNALSEFHRHADELVVVAQASNVNLTYLRMAARNLEMWGGTVDWHLANGAMSAPITNVAWSWAGTVTVWKELKKVLPQEPAAARFGRLYPR